MEIWSLFQEIESRERQFVGGNNEVEIETSEEETRRLEKQMNHGRTVESVRTFANVAGSRTGSAIRLIQTPEPQVEGGNVSVVLDEEEYSKGLEDNQFSALGRLSRQNHRIRKRRFRRHNLRNPGPYNQV